MMSRARITLARPSRISEAGGMVLDENLKPLESDLSSYTTRLSFIAAANQQVLDDIISEMNE